MLSVAAAATAAAAAAAAASVQKLIGAVWHESNYTTNQT